MIANRLSTEAAIFFLFCFRTKARGSRLRQKYNPELADGSPAVALR